MKNLIAIILFLICVTAHAANPSMAQLNFASNAIVAQISAAQVWTNDAAFGFLRTLPTNTFPTFINSSGGIDIGYATFPLWVPDSKDVLVSYRNVASADPATSFISIEETKTADEIEFGRMQATIETSSASINFLVQASNGFYSQIFLAASTNGAANAPLVRAVFGGATLLDVLPTVTTNATYIASLNGFASYSTLATNAVTPTGWTNTAGVNVSGYVTATAVSFTINDRSGAVLYTSPTLTATLPVSLQNGWSLRAASGLVGTILPW